MTSPSSTSSRRSTPWVDGCWGPMLTVSSSRSSPVSTRAGRSIVAIDLPCDREVDGLRAERFGAAQGVAVPLVGKHDAAQIGVALKVDSEQVEELALVPVGAGDNSGDAGCVAVRARLEP